MKAMKAMKAMKVLLHLSDIKAKRQILSALRKVLADAPAVQIPLPDQLPDLTEKMVELVCLMEYHMKAADIVKTPEFRWKPVYQKALFFHKRKKENAIRDFEKSFKGVDPEIVYNEYSDKFDKWVKDNLRLGSEPVGILKVKDLL